MAETKVISSLTITSVIGNDITIITSYQPDGGGETNILPDTILAFLAEIAATYGGVGYIEGELIIEMKNYPLQINFSIDNDGNLIISSTEGDLNKYSIDSEGNLIYTE